MGKRYGLPYLGSKSRYAERLIAAIPKGKRFVDLFGGGFAMSHCALLSGKWETVLYNEIQADICQLVRDAIAGKYGYPAFVPTWVSRERFFAEKDTDAYIRLCWSFGNNGATYIYGATVEESKRRAFECVVNGVPLDDGWAPDMRLPLHDRRMQWKRHLKGKRSDLESLESLERLERLQSLQSLPDRLIIQCGDYRDYRYQDGDIVYCDPPYANCLKDKYYTGTVFDYPAFIDWVKHADFPVFFSGYGGEFEAQSLGLE